MGLNGNGSEAEGDRQAGYYVLCSVPVPNKILGIGRQKSNIGG